MDIGMGLVSRSSGDSTQQESKGNDLKKELVGDTSYISDAVARYHHNEEMSDIILIVKEKKYHAHRFVLVLMSDVFKTMCSERWDNAQLNEFVLSESDQCVPVFPLFLHFLYHGTVHVTTTTALPLLMLADKYNVQPLKMSCEKYVRSQVEKGNVTGALLWLPYLMLFGHKDLELICIEMIILDMPFVLNCSEFVHLSLDLLKALLVRNDLVVECEYCLYAGVVEWLQHHKDQPHYSQYVETLIPLIRFSLMFPDQLLEIELSDFYKVNEDIVSKYVGHAHRFRSLAPEVIDERFSNPIYQPRNYLHPAWCQILNFDADNVSFYNKSVNLMCINDLLTASVPRNSNWKAKEATWQIHVRSSEKQENINGRRMCNCNPAENGPWKLVSPNVFMSSSSTNGMITLKTTVRSLKAIHENVIIDISMFLIKKNSIWKHLDTKTLLVKKSENVVSLSKFAQQKTFVQSPLNFTFNPSTLKKSPEVTLEHEFTRDQLENPTEAPCITFGPHFANPPRALHTVTVAFFVKPRVRTPAEVDLTAPVAALDECSEDEFPIFG